MPHHRLYVIGRESCPYSLEIFDEVNSIQPQLEENGFETKILSTENPEDSKQIAKLVGDVESVPIITGMIKNKGRNVPFTLFGAGEDTKIVLNCFATQPVKAMIDMVSEYERQKFASDLSESE